MKTLLIASALCAFLLSPGSVVAADIQYTFTGVTLTNADVFGPDPIPPSVAFSLSFHLVSPSPPSGNLQGGQPIVSDARDSYTVAGQAGEVFGFDGYLSTGVDDATGQRTLTLIGSDSEQVVIASLRSEYQIVVESSAFTSDYTKPGVYSEADGTLQALQGANFVLVRVLSPGFTFPPDETLLDVQTLVITNSDDSPIGTSPVPLPASASTFGAALVALGAAGYSLKRKRGAAA